MAEGTRRFSGTTAALLMVVLLGALSVGAGRSPQQGQAPAAQEKPAEADYAGSEPCSVCHEAIRVEGLASHKVLETSTHLGWQGRSCEACHGPGKTHSESADLAQILSFKTASAARVNQACLSCHTQDQRKGKRAFDAHARNSLSCVTCHSVHSSKARRLLADKPEALCVSCHGNVRAQFYRPYRHKLREGVIGCADCHNPHGEVQRAQLRRTAENQEACLKCHGDKRGPFVFEHAPVQLEGCSACHEPHGSVHPRMLNRPEQRFLCLECHTNSLTTSGGTPPAFHDLRSARFQYCTTCHNKIHGSYVNRAFLR